MSQTPASTEPERPASPNVTNRSGHRVRAIVNWSLAVLTVPGALFVMLVAFGFAMGTDRCAYENCARQGPPYLVMTLLFYGAPFVAALTVITSFRTAKRSWGSLIPLAALIFFGIDRVVLYLTSSQMADHRVTTGPAQPGTLPAEFSG